MVCPLAGREGANQGVKAWFFGLVGPEVAGCNGSSPSERCAYPDSVGYTFNASLTYNCPTLLSLPHYYRVSRKAHPVVDHESASHTPVCHSISASHL